MMKSIDVDVKFVREKKRSPGSGLDRIGPILKDPALTNSTTSHGRQRSLPTKVKRLFQEERFMNKKEAEEHFRGISAA